MRKKFLIFGIIFVLGIMLFVLTGCGSSSNNIADALNKVVKTSVDTWQEKGYAHTFSMSDIQSSLDKNYVIIASGDEKFTSKSDKTSYSEDIAGYSGETASNTRMLESDMDVNNCLVLDKSTGKYYNIEITYKTTNLNGTDKEYPYFQNAKEVK